MTEVSRSSQEAGGPVDAFDASGGRTERPLFFAKRGQKRLRGTNKVKQGGRPQRGQVHLPTTSEAADA